MCNGSQPLLIILTRLLICFNLSHFCFVLFVVFFFGVLLGIEDAQTNSAAVKEEDQEAFGELIRRDVHRT